VIADASSDLPEFRESSIAAVRLLQGVVYSDDTRAWDAVLTNQSELTDYFLHIGLVLVIDEVDGLAYLRQLSDAQREGSYESLPKLFRKTSLGYDATLMCVMLRDELRRFENEDVDNERCVVETDALVDGWRTFFPADEDEIKLRRRMATALSKLEKLKFVRKFHRDSDAWEIRRILKARLSIEELQILRDQLAAATQQAEQQAKQPDPQSTQAENAGSEGGPK
jgi:hypothetical protein